MLGRDKQQQRMQQRYPVRELWVLLDSKRRTKKLLQGRSLFGKARTILSTENIR